jgi:serine protein kinase
LNQIGIVKTEPGDENTQDISTLVGKIDLRMLERFAQEDPDAYSYSGALCLGSARCVEFVEMFKAPLKVLNPILTATQEGNFKGTEALPAMPFNGFIMAHSNEAEWLKFRNNKDNEAFIDRVYLVKVPYCLRIDEEVRIYDKMLKSSTLAEAPCAPQTLRTLGEFTVLSRCMVPENSSIYSKLRAYNGENLKDSIHAQRASRSTAMTPALPRVFPDCPHAGRSRRFPRPSIAIRPRSRLTRSTCWWCWKSA